MKKIALVIVCLISVMNAWSQKPKKGVTNAEKKQVQVLIPENPYVFAFAGDTVYKNEFVRLLNKNRKEKTPPNADEVREYLDLYIKFKLKVKEAMNRHLDTSSTFINELAGYRKQLANPYLTDKKVTESLINDAYERMKTEINASHILILCPDNASAADTLKAWIKIQDIRKRILKGESFDSIAYKNSEDPSAKTNFGNLGWFSVFQMVYPFESGAYHTNKGEVSLPIRTQFGYHIIKVMDKRPARGDVKVAHIMLRVNQNANDNDWTQAKNKIDTIYSLLQKNISFEEMVTQYSEDEGSKGNKGIMNWIASLSGYPDNFKDICFGLNEGEYSKPFKTDFGYHIVKLVEKRPLGELKEVQDVIKNKINRDSRSESSRSSVIARIKKENNVKIWNENLNGFIKSIDTSFEKGMWTYTEGLLAVKPLMTIAQKSYTTLDFAPYLKANQAPLEKGSSTSVAAMKLFNKWSDEKCLAYEESMLDNKYEDFRNIYKEYHDGILLFDLTDKMVWSKAVSDTSGLEKYYESNKGHYMWGERLSYREIRCKDEATAKDIAKRISKGQSIESIQEKLTKKGVKPFEITDLKAEKSNDFASKNWSNKGIVENKQSDATLITYVNGVVSAEPKLLKEARGSVISDYQNYLDKEWVSSLQKKYPVQINEEAIQSLITQ